MRNPFDDLPGLVALKQQREESQKAAKKLLDSSSRVSPVHASVGLTRQSPAKSEFTPLDSFAEEGEAASESSDEESLPQSPRIATVSAFSPLYQLPICRGFAPLDVIEECSSEQSSARDSNLESPSDDEEGGPSPTVEGAKACSVKKSEEKSCVVS
jgi:hypothetical protein